MPLVTEAFDWEHGVFLGSIMASETTAAAAGAVGNLRFDPLAMLPFCGYNMGDYFAHWLEIGAAPTPTGCRRSSSSTGSATDEDGRFLWPGLRREQPGAQVGLRAGGRRRPTRSRRPSATCPRPVRSTSTAWTWTPPTSSELLSVDVEGWRAAIPQIEQHYAQFGEHLPEQLRDELASLEKRLAATG